MVSGLSKQTYTGVCVCVCVCVCNAVSFMKGSLMLAPVNTRNTHQVNVLEVISYAFGLGTRLWDGGLLCL